MPPKTHVVIEGSERKALPGAVAVAPANPRGRVEVTVKVRRKKPLPELEGRPSAVISKEKFAKTYGARPNELAKVSRVLARFGLNTESSNPATRTVRLSGTVKEMEQAFAVKLFRYRHENEEYRGRTGKLYVPKQLDGLIEAVVGLDNRRMVRRRRQPVTARARSASSVPSSWYKPAELAAHYNYPSGDGTGQTIAVLEFGGGYFPNDLKKFCKLAGTPFPTVNPVSTDGTSTKAHDGEEGEVMLDIEVIAGVCPQAKIVAYFAEFTEQGWVTILDSVMHDTSNDVSVVSCSWGYAEGNDIWTQQAVTQVNQTLQEAAMLGITICIAAGDDGSSDAITDGLAHVDFPGSSPFTLAVGGTTIPVKGGTGADIVWFEGTGLRASNGGSTGGGVSAVFPVPSWQSSVAVPSVDPGGIAGRCVPDIAANADWVASPYLLVVDGKAQANGGTSAATPLIASLITLINEERGAGKQIGYLTPLLYQAQGSGTIGSEGCTDVVKGNNSTDKVGGYSATTGWDAASGWGTPNGANLLAALAAV